jgi:hypothetical protein
MEEKNSAPSLSGAKKLDQNSTMTLKTIYNTGTYLEHSLGGF